MVIHKDYKAPTFENDIAILELESPIERCVFINICLFLNETYLQTASRGAHLHARGGGGGVPGQDGHSHRLGQAGVR